MSSIFKKMLTFIIVVFI